MTDDRRPMSRASLTGDLKLDTRVAERVYIAGPIFGQPAERIANFFRCEEAVRRVGLVPVNAHAIVPEGHNGRACPPGRTGEAGHSDPCHMKADLAALLTCRHIALLPGWAESWGVRLELSVATACALGLWEFLPDPVGPGPRDSFQRIGAQS